MLMLKSGSALVCLIVRLQLDFRITRTNKIAPTNHNRIIFVVPKWDEHVNMFVNDKSRSCCVLTTYAKKKKRTNFHPNPFACLLSLFHPPQQQITINVWWRQTYNALTQSCILTCTFPLTHLNHNSRFHFFLFFFTVFVVGFRRCHRYFRFMQFQCTWRIIVSLTLFFL